MDHMTGLAKLSAEFDVANFWHTGHHDFNLADTTNEEWEDCPYDKADWEAFKRLRSGTYPRSFQLHQGDTGHFWTEDGIDVWAPTRELEQLAVEKNLANITSMILKISYKGVVIVLGGDATADETWPAIWPYIDMSGITVLKASHHGRKTGYYQRAVKEMSPWLTITSVGEKEYDATESYRQYSEHTVSLRQAGDVTITVSDEGQCFYSANVEEHWKPRRVAA